MFYRFNGRGPISYILALSLLIFPFYTFSNSLNQFSILEAPCEKDPSDISTKRDVSNNENLTPDALKGTDQGCKVGLRYCSQAIPDILNKISTVENDPAKLVKMKADLTPLILSKQCGPSAVNTAKKYGLMDMKIAGYYAGRSVHFDSPKRKPSSGCYDTSVFGPGTPGSHCNPSDPFPSPGCALMSVKVTENGGVIDEIHGQKESAYLRGAWIQALKCYQKQVMNEIKNEGGIRLSSGSTTAAGRDIASLYQKDQKVSGDIAEAVMKEINKSTLTPEAQGEFLNHNFCHNRSVSNDSQHLKVPDLCNNDFESQTGQEEEDQLFKNLTKHRMSACFLANARASTESAFIDLATNEIIARAYNHYNLVISASGKYSIFKLAMKHQVVSPCVDQQKKCRRYLKMVPPQFQKAKQCALDTFDGCYKQKMPQFFKAFIDINFPNNGSCLLSGGLGGLFSWKN